MMNNPNPLVDAFLYTEHWQYGTYVVSLGQMALPNGDRSRWRASTCLSPLGRQPVLGNETANEA